MLLKKKNDGIFCLSMWVQISELVEHFEEGGGEQELLLFQRSKGNRLGKVMCARSHAMYRKDFSFI